MENFKKKLYKAYQLDWMISHGYSLNHLFKIFVECMKDSYTGDEINLNTLAENAKSLFLYETGFDGDILPGIKEFLDCEYKDTVYMEHLFECMSPLDRDDCKKAWFEDMNNKIFAFNGKKSNNTDKQVKEIKTMKTYEDILRESGREQDAMDLLAKLVKTLDASFPLSSPMMDCDNNNYYHETGDPFRVSGKDVRGGAEVFLDKLKLNVNEKTELTRREEKQLTVFYHYIKDCGDTDLHNYAIQISHRTTSDETLMERARLYMSINCIVDDILLPCYDPDTRERCLCYIPEGWYKS